MKAECRVMLLLIAVLVAVGAMWGRTAGREASFAGQVIAGTVGGALFGAAGHWIGIEICSARDEGPDVAGRCWLPGVYGYLVGVPVGAALGVSVAGASYGVPGNHLLAAAGAVVGEALGIGIMAVFEGTLGGEEAFFLAAYGLVPFFSAALSATGYRAGAPAPGYSFRNGPEGALLSFALSRVPPGR